MPKCELCKSERCDDVKYGELLTKNKISVHTFCLYLTSNLKQSGEDDEGFLGFLPADIKQETKRISRLSCCYCGKSYANIGCCARKCRRSFHTICGLEHGVENHFKGTYQSFCDQHVRKVQYRPARDELCCICYDSLQDGKRFRAVDMLRAPCCRNGWFHKLCLQTFARTSGYFFKCPLCNDNERFCEKLSYSGIYIPNRDAAWELEPNAFAELLERPSSCTAVECQNMRGRTEQSERNPLLLCVTCGSVAMHKICLSTADDRQRRGSRTNFNCDDCYRLLSADSGRESLVEQQRGEDSDTDSEDEEANDVDVCHNDSDTDSDNVKDTTKPGEEEDSAERFRNVTRRRKIQSALKLDDDDEEEVKEAKIEYVKVYKEAAENDEEEEEEPLAVPKKLNHSLRIFDESDEDDNGFGECDDVGFSQNVNIIAKISTNLNPIDSNSSNNSDTDEDEDALYKKKIRGFAAQRSRIISETASEASSAAGTSNACSKLRIVSSGDTICTVISDENDSDDDPLENFHAYAKRKQASQEEELRQQSKITNIANRLRRKSLYRNSESSGSDEAAASSQTLKLPTHKLKTVAADSDNADDHHFKAQQVQKEKETSSKKLNELEISCIARRTRRKSIFLENKNKCVLEKPTTQKTELEQFTRKLCKNFEATAHENGQIWKSKESRALGIPKTNLINQQQIASNALDISCIAKRTRRKSFASQSELEQTTQRLFNKVEATASTNSQNDITHKLPSSHRYEQTRERKESTALEIHKQQQQQMPSNALDVSCIAKRTRRKSFASQTASNSSESEAMRSSTNTKKQFNDDTADDSVSSYGSTFSSTSSAFSSTTSSATSENPLEISCVGNRTRQRKSLGQTVYKKTSKRLSCIPETPLSSSNSLFSTSSSSTFYSLNSRCTVTTTPDSSAESFRTIPSSGTEFSSSSSSSSASSNRRSRDKLKRALPSVPTTTTTDHNFRNYKSKRTRLLSSNDGDDDSFGYSAAATGSKLLRRNGAAAWHSDSSFGTQFDPFITPTLQRISARVPNLGENDTTSSTLSASSGKHFWKSREHLAHSSSSDDFICGDFPTNTNSAAQPCQYHHQQQLL